MILYIDDDPFLVKSYVEDLRLDKHEVECSRTVDNALKFFQDNLNKIELVVLDIMMSPGKAFKDVDTADGTRTGIVLFPRLRALAPQVPIIILTNVADDEDERTFSNQQECWFHTKDRFLPFQLCELVKEILSKRTSDRRSRTGE